MFTHLETGLENVATYTLKNMIAPNEQKEVVGALEKIMESVSRFVLCE